MNKKITYSSAVGILALTAIFSVPTFATDNTDIVDQINITIPVSCTLSGTNLLHTDTIQNNQYKTDIGSATIKATCNDTNGLAIYAIGYTNDEYGNNQMIDSSLDSAYNIDTGKYISGTTTNSVWSMKLTPVSGTYAPTIRNDASYNYTNYELIPDTYTKVAYRTTATDTGTGSTGANFTTDYAVYASATQPAGTYTGKVKFTLVHPQDAEAPAQPIACEAGKICYNSNANDVVGEMGKQTATDSTDIMLWASNFKRTGYGFAGWNTAFDYSGTTYGPQETITTPSDTSTKGLSLYAVWVPSAGTMQDWDGCSNLTQGSVTALKDDRDDDVYAVAKLVDGKCWMIENLRLDNTPELSILNTNNPSLPLTNVYSTSSTSNHLSPTSSLYDATTAPEGWCISYRANCIDQSRLRTDNTILFINNDLSNYSISSDIYSYGNYYNWYSATAGHGKYSSEGDYTVPGDICPVGWHLPVGMSSEGFDALYIAMRSVFVNINSGFRSYPTNYIYSGYVDGPSIESRNIGGYYWTASGDSTRVYARFMTINGSNYVYTDTNTHQPKHNGATVRCVIDE